MPVSTFIPPHLFNADPDTLARELYDEPMVMMPSDDALPLTAEEMHTGLWKKITGWIDQRLGELREQNDSSISLVETEKLRGKIEILKEMRSAGLTRRPLDEEDPPLPGDDLGY